MPRAVFNGVVIAEGDDTVVVGGTHYFLRGALREQYFRPSSKTSLCPWKGRAAYLDVVVGDRQAPGGAWYYPRTWRRAERIRGRVAFGRGVEVVP